MKHGNKKRKIVLKRNLVIEVNGAEITSFPSYVLGDYVVITMPSSTNVSVAMKNGFRVFYDGSHKVDVDSISLYSGKMVGLCVSNGSHKRNKRSTEGNDKDLDWVAKLMQNSCIGESCKTIAGTPNPSHPCETNAEVKQQAEKMCSQLKSDVFADCHQHVIPESHYKNCLYDVCAFKNDMENWMCSTFTAYANECSRLGNPLMYWRKSISDCGKFDSMIFHIQIFEED